MASGKRMTRPMPCADSGPFADDAEAGAAPREGVAEEQEDREPGDRRRDARRRAASRRRGPVTATNAVQSAAVEQVGERAPDEHRGAPHGERPEAVDDAAVEVGAEPDRGAHRRGGEVQREQAGDREVRVAAAAGQDDAGAEHVDEQQREQHRLDGDVGELQRLARDVHEVAAGEHDDVADLAREAGAIAAAAASGRGRERVVVAVIGVLPPGLGRTCSGSVAGVRVCRRGR